ncbi:hypothetical protein PanWU01x14_105150 [Parasponia andersonii]|uniref:Uncharacterized protein n=1 Tax=Parasponia andersonii TaxID=3476 RepID=A0A2P5D1F0_PARAD|nr:hypothetical protein PanWU01x14_105150 [Parasponia andersonii]
MKLKHNKPQSTSTPKSLVPMTSLTSIVPTTSSYPLAIILKEQASLYAFKDYNENAPAITFTFDNQKKVKEAVKKIAAKESLLFKAKIAHDNYE